MTSTKLNLFLIICTFIGVIVGSGLIYLFQGTFPYEVIIGGLVGAVILMIAEVIKRRNKQDNIPESDERVRINVSNFFANTSHITLIILFIIVGGFTILGAETISISYLWIFILTYIFTVAIGVTVVRKR